jgi:hypothetical protein
MSYFLDTGAHGFTVEFSENDSGEGELKIRYSPAANLNSDFSAAIKHPAIATEMALGVMERGGLSYLQFSTIVGLLVKLCRTRAAAAPISSYVTRSR